nr:MAG TPA: hypothetical protein [Caudoviricetes sp.]
MFTVIVIVDLIRPCFPAFIYTSQVLHLFSYRTHVLIVLK